MRGTPNKSTGTGGAGVHHAQVESDRRRAEQNTAADRGQRPILPGRWLAVCPLRLSVGVRPLS